MTNLTFFSDGKWAIKRWGYFNDKNKIAFGLWFERFCDLPVHLKGLTDKSLRNLMTLSSVSEVEVLNVTKPVILLCFYKKCFCLWKPNLL